METIRGKQTSFINTAALAEQAAEYRNVHIDLGTGDGRFVQHMAQTCLDTLVIGVDACRENLHEVSRRAGTNALFVIANALTLPEELYGLAANVTINFPWGSLIQGLLAGDEALLSGLASIMRPNAMLEVRLNAGALNEAGWSLEPGAAQVRQMLAMNGFTMQRAISLAAPDLKAFPTTWAKRLAFGRDPRAMVLRGIRERMRMAESA